MNSPELKVIELDNDWVKFTLGRRHIVLPQKFMVEGAIQREWEQGNFPLGREIVDKDSSLPEAYVPDDLVKIPQKWNFHTPDYPKYLRSYVADRIEKMLQNAEEQGVHIRVFSAYRSYERQRYLYLNEIARSGKNQNKVAKPGHCAEPEFRPHEGRPMVEGKCPEIRIPPVLYQGESTSDRIHS